LIQTLTLKINWELFLNFPLRKLLKKLMNKYKSLAYLETKKNFLALRWVQVHIHHQVVNTIKKIPVLILEILKIKREWSLKHLMELTDMVCKTIYSIICEIIDDESFLFCIALKFGDDDSCID
jgi:hypothetical protein